MKKDRKLHRLNIYLTNQDRKVLNEIKEKYHISYSTIAKVIFRHLIKNHSDKFSVMIWGDHYLFKDDHSTKTSIKPRLAYDEEPEFWKSLHSTTGWECGGMCMLFTNTIKAFTRNKIQECTSWEQKTIEKVKSQIYNQFQQEFDPNWNGNEFIHRTVKIFKSNPNYWNKILKKEED